LDGSSNVSAVAGLSSAMVHRMWRLALSHDEIIKFEDLGNGTVHRSFTTRI
jgi:hypothetical protein